MQGRIKIGSVIIQYHRARRWPKCYPPTSEYLDGEYKEEAKNPDMLFDIKPLSRCWEATAEGYGGKEYGNGSIIVIDKNAIEIVE